MEGYVTHAEHEEFCRRIDERDKRQNEKIETLEQSVKQIGSLSASVEKLAINMEAMLKEQTRQGERLETLEARDGEKWRQMVGYVGSAIAGGIVTLLISFLF